MGVVPLVELVLGHARAGGSLNTRCTYFVTSDPLAPACASPPSLHGTSDRRKISYTILGCSSGRSVSGSADTGSPPPTIVPTPARSSSSGTSALWFGEAPGGKEAFTRAATLLAATESLVIATGIASIWGRDAAQHGLGDPHRSARRSRAASSPGSASATRRRSRCAAPSTAPPLGAMKTYLAEMSATTHLRPRRPSRRRSCSPRCARGCSSWLATPPMAPTRTSCRSSTHAGRARSSGPAGSSRRSWQSCSNPIRSRRAGSPGCTPVASTSARPNYVENLRWLGFDDRRLRRRRFGRAGRRHRGVGGCGGDRGADRRTPRCWCRPRVPATGDERATAPDGPDHAALDVLGRLAPVLRGAGLLDRVTARRVDARLPLSASARCCPASTGRLIPDTAREASRRQVQRPPR